MKTSDIISGAFNISGAWGTISGASASIVMRILNAEMIKLERVSDILYDPDLDEYIVFVHIGKREL